MIPNKKYNKILTIVLLVAFVASLFYTGKVIMTRLQLTNSVRAQNVKIDKTNHDIRTFNKETADLSLQNKATIVLSGAFNGSLTNAPKMWDSLHNQKVITGLESLQGDNKDYFKSTYFNGVTSNVNNIHASELSNGQFILTFTYNTTSLTGAGNTQSRQLLYVATGHKDGDTYHIDDLKHTNSANY